jgi:hypothetical protein
VSWTGARPLAIAALASGCAGAITASTHVPNPLVVAAAGASGEVTYDISVQIKDLKQPEGIARPGANQAGVNNGGNGAFLPGYVQPRYFQQAAMIQFARADEIHFSVLLTSEWKELTRLEHYQMQLSDDRGQVIAATDSWMKARTKRDYEATYQSIKRVQSVRIHEGAQSETYNVLAPEESYVSERVHRGLGTVVFRHADLLRPDTRWIKLTLRSRSRTFQFTWYFDRDIRT